MEVTSIKCKKCGDIIYSRARHDMIWCSCHSCAIDGGQTDYVKITGNSENFEVQKVEIDATLTELYDDWNYGNNKFGRICK